MNALGVAGMGVPLFAGREPGGFEHQVEGGGPDSITLQGFGVAEWKDSVAAWQKSVGWWKDWCSCVEGLV